MDVFDTIYWCKTKYLLLAIGVWPFQSKTQWKVLGALVYLLVQSIFTCVFLKVAVAWGNLAETLYSIPILVYFSIIQVKITNCHLNFEKAKYLLLQVKKDYESNLEVSEYEILRNDARSHKMIISVYYCGLVFVAVIYCILPLMSPILNIFMPLNETRERILPYPAEYFVDINKHYYLFYLHGAIIAPVAITISLAFDSLYASFILHTSSMFTIIGRRLENLAQNDTNKKKLIGRDNRFYSFVVCVKMHQDILQFAELVEKYYSNYFFFLLGIIVLGLSLTGFQFVVLARGIGEKVRCLWYAMGQVVHLFFLSYFGQKLIDSSQNINASISAADWYNYPKKIKLLIIMILMRGRILSRITAGKIYVMSIENFSSVIKSSMSYFAVLTSMES